MSELIDKLKGGDRRSIGQSGEVVNQVLKHPELFPVLFDGMLHEDAVVRMRAADVVEKITRQRPALLHSFKEVLIHRVAAIEQQEVRWHVAQMMPRLEWSEEEKSRVMDILFSYLDDKSKIVQTNALQAMADIAEKDNRLLPHVVEVIKKKMQSGSAAIKSRGHKLLKKLQKNSQ